MKDILLFSSVISATDTVSSLAFISQKEQNKLFEVLFGEGIMNDSLSIVMYQIITRFYNIFTSTQMIAYYLFIFLKLSSWDYSRIRMFFVFKIDEGL